MANPLVELEKYGQSPWYDNIRRGLITSGELQQMIDQDGLKGVTSNPAIFEKAIAGSTDYDEAIEQLVRQDKTAMEIYEALAIEDIQRAADVMRPVYDRTNGRDGFVSLEVSPYLANDTEGTIAEAKRLWADVRRDNVMIKVPATTEGIPAIQHLIGEGMNINVTLMFSYAVYEAVAEAYVAGLETLAARGGDLSRVNSVASFFISRIDTLIDGLLEEKLKSATRPRERTELQSLIGKVAIANARLTYQRYQQLFSSGRWNALAGKGAKTQRMLWASTSTKNPNYRDVLYVEELIGEDTINTMPAATFIAFRDHGRPRPSLEAGIDEARDTMGILDAVGISMDDMAAKLVAGGVRLFAEPFEKLLNAIEEKKKALQAGSRDGQRYAIGGYETVVHQTLDAWKKTEAVRRLWEGDTSLWTGKDEDQWLGWLHITEQQLEHVAHLTQVAEDVRQGGFSDVLLLGMGGSSLCPEVMQMTFGEIDGYPKLHVLDSTVPAQVKTFEENINLSRTLCIVASKSGSTTEPNVFRNYFFNKIQQSVGIDRVGQHFIAITDPGSKVEIDGKERGFRHILSGVPSIGGRYSALSDFGMAPAAIMGVDVKTLLERAEQMAQSCAACVPPEENPGAALGIVLGELANAGRDKVTIITSPVIGDLGAWMEQLIAESTGKEGKGLIPVDNEPLGDPSVYGEDRVFVYVRLESAPDPAQDAAVDTLEASGQPVVRIRMADPLEIGAEFFRWEFATAVAGAVLGINAFNQPNVQESKDYTKSLTDEYEQTGKLPSETPILEADGIRLFTDEANAGALRNAASGTGFPAGSLESYLAAHLNRLGAGDYAAFNAYIEMNTAHQTILREIRQRIRDTKRVATTVGFGPRFLHSTGQLHKGGPNSGVFTQITSDDAEDLPVPGKQYTFGILKAAQATGDFLALSKRSRRALRVHLPADVAAGLARLQAAVEAVTK